MFGKHWRKQKGRLSTGAIVLALFLLDQFLPITQPFEYMARDAVTRAHLGERAPTPGIILINIDEQSLDRLSDEYGRWPWSRAVHARLLERLLEQEPRAIVFDIVMSDSNRADIAGDEALIRTATDADNVFFPMVVLPKDQGRTYDLSRLGYRLGFDPGSRNAQREEFNAVLPMEPLAMTGRIGAINMLMDPDGLARRYYLYLDRAGWHIPSLPARLARYLGIDLPASQAIDLHWNAGPYVRESYSYADVLMALTDDTDDTLDDLFKDTIVIIGGDAIGLYDLRATPVSDTHPGADILATAIGNLVQGDYLQPAPSWLAPLLGLLLFIAIYAAFLKGRGLLIGGIVLPLSIVSWLIAAEAALSANLILPIIPVFAFAVILYLALGIEQTLRERAARDQAVSTFGRFMDPRVVQSLIKEEGNFLEAPPQSREVTVLFSDIRGFTTLSETRSPEEIIALLNRYFERQVEVIFRHGGTIDKFIGDAIMAFWGAPVDDPEQADNAVDASLEMIKVVREIRDELAASGIPFDIGIGLHTGPAVVGFVGSQNRLDYTVIGDTVNLASRIEGQTKGRARLLVSDDTRQRCKRHTQFKDHGSVQVKGRERPVTLYEPEGE